MKKSKKLLMSSAVMLSLCIGFGSVAGASAYEMHGYTFIMPGDADSSRNVDINDATLIQQHLAACKNIEIDLSVSDYDGDGSVTVDDVTSIQKMLAGYTDYACVITPEEYLAYEGDMREKLPEFSPIEHSLKFENCNIFPDANKEKTSKVALITSKEEFFALFKCYSPEFDEDYFEQNALVVYVAYSNIGGIDYFLSRIGVSGNTLCVDVGTIRFYTWQEGDDNIYADKRSYEDWFMLCQVNKSDVSNIDKILAYEQEIMMVDP